MFNHVKKTYYSTGAAIMTGLMFATESAHAGNNFGDIAENIQKSVANIPGLVTALSYLFGILLAVLGIMKIKDHVENPTQTPLKDGAIRLAAGGALFALPIIFEAMLETVGTDNAGVTAAEVKSVKFNVVD